MVVRRNSRSNRNCRHTQTTGRYIHQRWCNETRQMHRLNEPKHVKQVVFYCSNMIVRYTEWKTNRQRYSTGKSYRIAVSLLIAGTVHKQTDKQPNKQTDRDKRTDKQRHKQTETNRQTSRQTDKQTDKQTNGQRQRNRQTDRQIDIWRIIVQCLKIYVLTNKQTNKQTDRQTETSRQTDK